MEGLLVFLGFSPCRQKGERPGRIGGTKGFVSTKMVPRPHKCGGRSSKCAGGRIAGGLGVARFSGISFARGRTGAPIGRPITVVAALAACTARTTACLVSAGKGFRSAHHNARFTPLFFLRRFAWPGIASWWRMKQTLGGHARRL